MADVKYLPKDRLVKIFKSKSVSWKKEGQKGQYLEKRYIHPKGTYIRAYVRQEAGGTDSAGSEVMPTDRFLIVIGYRRLERDAEYYVEWSGRLLKVLAPDGYEHRRDGELKLSCQEIPSDGSLYRKTSYEEWKR